MGKTEKLAGKGPAPMISAVGGPWTIASDWGAYWVDACQRSVLYWDTLRQRGNQFKAHAAQSAPHVLKFGWELVVDGRQLPRPVNYALVRITPQSGTKTDPRKRPFVVVDPRAGHGPGIGGFKPDSEIGVALKAGHPCYFVGFLPEPMPGQTIQDIAAAEATFLERVIALHPEADGKPAVIGNCQAGWAIMIVAALRPELFGPIILAGSPLSYWAGVRGQNPMRYTGGLLGGSWLTALAGDLGKGRFDGALLVSNFENLNPSNTYWSKSFNLYEKVDTEGPRFLEFEQWWGGHVILNAEEMQFIVDNLFVGNKLSSNQLRADDGTPVDLRNIRSPIVVFCSHGDNITPPQQALGWILDLYGSVDDIRARGQTIVYSVHDSIGHLGIFVSGSVAKKEHDEFASNIDLIDVLPPGLYEAVLTPRDPGDASSDYVEGNYLIRFEARTLDHIRALGCNSAEDDRKFATVARVSEINLGLYKTMMRPWVQALANEAWAKWSERMNPARLQYEIFADTPLQTRFAGDIVERVKEHRSPVPPDNVFWQLQSMTSDWIEKWLDGYRDVRDKWQEDLFHAIYGSPILQAMVGLSGSEGEARIKPGEDALHRELVARRIDELRRSMDVGGPLEATVRALVYVRLPGGAVDERAFVFLQKLKDEAGRGLDLATFKALLREQFFMLLVDEERAVEAIPRMLRKDPDRAHELRSVLQRLLKATGSLNRESRERLVTIEKFFKAAIAEPDREKIETSYTH